MLTDTIADLVLAFSNTTVIVFILLTGFALINRDVFFQAACLAAFSVVINVALKGSFKVPLPPHLGSNYAFPSGHMQLSVVIYVWLALSLPYLSWRIFVGLLLPGIAAGIIHYHYHTLYEVLGGVFFGLLLLACYSYALKHLKERSAWLLLIIGSILMIYNAIIYTTIPAHTWPAYYVLLGLLSLEGLTYKCRQKKRLC